MTFLPDSLIRGTNCSAIFKVFISLLRVVVQYIVRHNAAFDIESGLIGVDFLIIIVLQLLSTLEV